MKVYLRENQYAFSKEAGTKSFDSVPVSFFNTIKK